MGGYNLIKSEIDGVYESELYPGYYADVKGNVYYLNDHNEITKSKLLNRGGYLAVHDQFSVSNEIGAHRIVCSVFHGLPPDEKHNIVNHIDGKPNNNIPSNLEWVSHSDNLLHAMDTGLRDDRKYVFCKDIQTGEKFEFFGLGPAANFFGVSKYVLCCYINSDTVYPLRGRFEVSYNPDDLNKFQKYNLGIKKRPYLTLIGIDQDTGRICSMLYMKSFLRELDVRELDFGNSRVLKTNSFSIIELSKCLRKNLETFLVYSHKTDSNWVLMSDYTYVAHMDISDKQPLFKDVEHISLGKTNDAVRPPKPIIAVKGNDVLHFNSIYEASKHFGINKAALGKRIYLKISVDGYEVKYN